MDFGAHTALARAYLAESVRLEERGVHQLAAEAVWGAANLAIEAVRHTRGLRHGNYYDKAQFVAELTAINPPQPDLTAGLQNVKDKLHNHFYTNRLSAVEAARWLIAGRNFVEQMLVIAESPLQRTGES